MTRVIMVALDGLRPDMVDPIATPHLHTLGVFGARFSRARSVFPSETRVATPSLITGCRPGGHGLVANTLFDASVAPDRLIRTKLVEDVLTLAAGAESPLQRPSLAERLAPHGLSFALVSAGTAGAARLPGQYGVMAGKTGTTQVRRVSREQRERGFNVATLPREWRPHALFVAYAPYENPVFALSVIVEHGTSGSGAAAPLARDILVEAFQRLPIMPTPRDPRVAELGR